MATTDVINGTDLIVYVDFDGNGTKEAIALATSHSLSVNMETRDKTNKDSGGWEEHLEGLRSWTLSSDTLVAFDQGKNLDEVFDLIINRTKVELKLSTEETGDKYFQGSAYCTSDEVEAPTEDNVTMSLEFQGTGKLEKLDVT